MDVYGKPVNVVDSDDPAEPSPVNSLAGQFGWAYYPMREEAEPALLLDVEAESGQVVLRDDGRDVRWSLLLRDADGTYQYVESAEREGSEVKLRVKPKALGDAREERVPAIRLLQAAKSGREYLALA